MKWINISELPFGADKVCCPKCGSLKGFKLFGDVKEGFDGLIFVCLKCSKAYKRMKE